MKWETFYLGSNVSKGMGSFSSIGSSVYAVGVFEINPVTGTRSDA